MKERFEGEDGRRRLVEALKGQRLVEHNVELAAALASAGELVEFPVGSPIVTQGGDDNEAFFIVTGEASVLVNDRPVATRGPGDCVGEMALIDPTARRSATVVPTKPTLALRVPEPAFQEVARAHPSLWQPIARVLADRLRQRERFHRSPNPQPVVFIGSSVEGLAIAQEIQLGLKHDKLVVRPWSTPGVFGPGGVSIDSLLKEVDQSDFAAFVFGPDDKVVSREERYQAPRDNVIFELGLFMGRLDRNRAFIIKEQRSDIKIPTDLLGVTPITYVHKPGDDLSGAVTTVCHELRKVVNKVGVR